MGSCCLLSMEQTTPTMGSRTVEERDTHSDLEHSEGEDTFDEEPKKPMILKKNSKFSEELVSGLLKNLNPGVTYKLDPKTESELINVMNKKVSSEVSISDEISENESETLATFEDQPDKSHVMSSSTKNRVQVPKNRRPPSKLFSQDDLLKIISDNGMDKDEVNFDDLISEGLDNTEDDDDGFNELFTNLKETEDIKVEEETSIDNDFNSLLIENEICEDNEPNNGTTDVDPFESLIQDSLEQDVGSYLVDLNPDTTDDLLDLGGIQSNDEREKNGQGMQISIDNLLLDIENEKIMETKKCEKTDTMQTDTQNNTDLVENKPIDDISESHQESSPERIEDGLKNIFPTEQKQSDNQGILEIKPKLRLEDKLLKDRTITEEINCLSEETSSSRTDMQKKRYEDEIKSLKMQLNSVRISSANEIASLEKEIEKMQDEYAKQDESFNELQTKYDESERNNKELYIQLDLKQTENLGNVSSCESTANEDLDPKSEFSITEKDDLLFQVLQLNDKVVSQDALLAELKEDNIVLRSQNKSLLDSGNNKMSKIKAKFSSLGGGDPESLLTDSFVWEDPSDIRKKLLQVEEELEDQKEVNSQLKSYVGDVLVNIMLKNPQILEKRQ